ncbi:antitoxin [Acinetobacter cumulans]|uniref:antitoxin n=1 Tax=Acinetobacter cumulans TaxID=2136182 RepID=UPI00207B368A|nr:AbrB/MazE/SpoVT family DNA-binding domain-containing protein [Acinetobacter cumulans]
MIIAKVFMKVHSQTIHLPKEFRFKGKEVEIFRRGDDVILREKQLQQISYLKFWRKCHPNFM